MKTIILVGIPGSGKSSILKETLRKNHSFTVVNYGDVMLEEANAEGITRDMLRKTSISLLQEIRIKAARRIMQEKHDITVIDTHALIKTDVGFCPGLPKEVLKVLMPEAFVWIDCPPSLIIQRRANDLSRTRDKETEEELVIHQELTHSFLTACCMETGAMLCRIQNKNPSIEQNSQPLIRLIENI